MKVAATILVLALSTLGQYAYAGDYINVRSSGGCDKNMGLRDLDECLSAAASLGYPKIVFKLEPAQGHLPYGCLIIKSPTGWDNLYFNTLNGRTGYAPGRSICKKAPDCGCGTVTAAQDGCQCGKEWKNRCKTGQRCVEGQCKTISPCKQLKRIPMSRDKKAECINECRKTYCSGGCQSYNLNYGYSDENKNGCLLSSCPYKG